MTTPPVVLSARNLHKEFRVLAPNRLGKERFVAVEDVSFELVEGGSLAVVGESGSGKSTCARMVMGLERPDSGSVELGGVPVSAHRKRDRSRWCSKIRRAPSTRGRPSLPRWPSA